MDPHFDGVIFQTYAAELARRMERDWPPFAVLDVRSPEEYARGHIPGAVRVDPEALAEALPEGTDARTELIVVGRGPDDERVRRASLALKQVGARRRVELTGGMDEWTAEGRPTEPTGRAAA